MGALDLLSPVLQFLDLQLASFLPALIRIILWGSLFALMSMWLYRLLSRQQRLVELKQEIQAIQARMKTFDGPFNELTPLIRKNLLLSLRRLLMTLMPALIAGLPVILLLAWASTRFGYHMPAAGDPVTLRAMTVEQMTVELRSRPAQRLQAQPDPNTWQIVWPDRQHPVVVLSTENTPLVELPLIAAVPVVHPRLWWNTLLANPAGYLDVASESPIQALIFDLTPQRHLPFGPGWLGSWWFILILTLLVVSLLLKWRWRLS